MSLSVPFDGLAKKTGAPLVPSNRKPHSLFISYAHSDGAELALRLAADLSTKGFQVWWDKDRLMTGASWTTEIESAIDSSEVVLALLSKGSYESDICRAEQLRALRKRKRVLPLVLQEETDLPIHLESEQYLAFHGAAYEHSLSQLLAAIANERLSASLLPRYKHRYRTYPPLPLHFIPRPELLANLRKQIIKEGDERCVAVTALRGMGGIGKTVLAQAICHDEAVQDAFPDGVMWATIGENPSNNHLREQIREIAKALGESLDGYDSIYGCENQLRTVLSNKSVLIVLDDVWDPRDVRYFSADAPRCRLLITTRSQEVVRGTDAQEFSLNVMEREESLQLLARKSGLSVSDLPVEATEMIRECGALPLGLAMLGARAGKIKSEWTRVLRSLKEGRAHAISLKLADYRYSDLFETIQVSVQSLRPLHQSRYLDLAVFKPDTPIPVAVLSTFWETDELDTDDTVASWVAASLANRDAQEQLILHDLQLDYVYRQATDLKGLHSRLLRAYSNTRKNGWESGPHDGYYFRWLAHHMQEAGELQELRLLLLNPEWIRARLEDQNITGLIDDFEFISSDSNLRLIQQALQLSFDVLTRDPKQFASQLFGRLRSNPSPEIQNFLENIRNTQEHAWLEPMWSSLWRPGALLLFTLAGHSRSINTVAILPDGKRVISGSIDHAIKIWDIEHGHELFTLLGHSGPVNVVAVTPDGELAVSGSHDKTVRVWRIDNGTAVFTLTGHTGKVRNISIIGNRRAASSADDNTIKIWDLANGEMIHSLTGHTHAIRVLQVTRDGKWLFSASDDHTIKVWNLETNTESRTLIGHKGAVNDIAITPDGTRLISGSNDTTLIVWDIKTGEKLRTLTGHNGWVNKIAISPNGQRVVSASADMTLKAWNPETGTEIYTLLGHTDSVDVVAITKDGSRIVSASPDHTARVWEMANGSELRSLTAHSGSVKAVLMTSDGTRAVSFSDDSTIRVWKTGTEFRDLDGHSHMVKALAVVQDGKAVLSGSYDKNLKLWDLQTGLQVHTLSGHTGPVLSLAIAPDGYHAVSASSDKTLKLWDLNTGQALRTFSGHTAAVTSVILTLDGRRAVSASYDKTVKIWDLQNGQTLHTLQTEIEPMIMVVAPAGMKMKGIAEGAEVSRIGRSTCVAQAVLTSDDKILISACCDKSLTVWNTDSGSKINSLGTHSEWISAIAITDDGEKAISASFDKTIQVWDLANGHKLQAWRAHSSTINQLLCFGKEFVLSASIDCTLRLWNMNTAALITTMEGHSAAVNAAGTNSSGTYIYSASDDHTLRAWKQNGEEIAAFSADGSMLCVSVPKDKNGNEDMVIAGDFLGRIHLMKLHLENSSAIHSFHESKK